MISKDDCAALNQTDEGEVVTVYPMLKDVLKYFVEHLFKQSCMDEGGLSSYPGDVNIYSLLYMPDHNTTLKMTIGGEEYNLIVNLATRFGCEQYGLFTLYKEEDGIDFSVFSSLYRVKDVAVLTGLRYILLSHQPSAKGANHTI